MTTTTLPSPAAERRRVAAHIERAERVARAADAGRLAPLQALVRALLLDALARYRRRGAFPKNPGAPDLTPSFVDAEGTCCAMAHLLELGGEGELVARLARERNHARVRELADEPRLVAWLTAAGLTVDEAAAIQPGYCASNWQCICGGGFAFVQYPVPARGVLVGTVVGPAERSPYAAPVDVRVTAVHGDAQGIVVGQEVSVYTGGSHEPLGTTILAPIGALTVDGGMAQPQGVALASNGLYVCTSIPGGGPAPAIRPDQFIAAVLSSDCRNAVGNLGGQWSQLQCAEGGGTTEGFCGVAPGATADDPTTLGVLCALVTALALRPRRARVRTRS